MKVLTSLIFSLCCLYSVHTSSYLSTPFSSASLKKCREPGLFCESCSSLVACIDDGEGFIKEPIETCESPTSCSGGTCVENTTDPFCTGLADLKFICRHVGLFPDPFYCNKFVICVDTGSSSLKTYLNECEPGFQFNVANSLCDIKLDNGECEEGEYPIPLCTAPGESNALPDKPEFFYVCERYSTSNDVLYPVLNVCPGGQVYANYKCVDGDASTTTQISSSDSIS